MIRVRFAPGGKAKILLGSVEVDGVDVSGYVTGVKFQGGPMTGYTLTLDLFVGADGDDIEFVVDNHDAELRVRPRSGDVTVYRLTPSDQVDVPDAPTRPFTEPGVWIDWTRRRGA